VRTRPAALWNAPDVRAFWPVAVLAAYDSIGFELVGPVLPAIQLRAGATPLEASAIFAVFSVGMLAGFAVGGATVRRSGPRMAAVTGVTLHLVADLLFIGAHSPQVYVIGRLLQGFGSGEIWMASVLCVLARWPDGPGVWLGRMITAYAVGAVVGPLLAALGGAVRPFVGDAILSATGFLAAFAMPARHGRTFDWGLGVLRDRRLAFGSLVALLNALVFTTIEGSYTLRFATRLSQGELGLLIALVTVTFGIGAAIPAASESGARGRRAGQLALLLSAAAIVAIAAADSPALWFVLAAVLGIGVGMSETSAVSMVARTPEDTMLTAMTLASQAFAIGYLIAPPTATWITGTAGMTASGLAVAAVAVITAGLAWFVPFSGGERNAPAADARP
jgi:MFS family permease